MNAEHLANLPSFVRIAAAFRKFQQPRGCFIGRLGKLMPGNLRAHLIEKIDQDFEVVVHSDT